MMTGYDHRFDCRKCGSQHFYINVPSQCGRQGCKGTKFRRVNLDPRTGVKPSGQRT